MKLLKMMMMGVFLAGTPVLLTACEDETQLEESMEEAGDEIENATD
tara:strand:- start:128 stop:265 length:138 start_codon:yes stop_codon:yes gene_type:complete